MSEEKLYLAIDPGKDKCGIALVTSDTSPLLMDIVKTDKVDSYLQELFHKYKINLTLLGDGTFSNKIKTILKDKNLSDFKLINEKNTTYKAEKRYRKENSLTGFKKFLNKIIDWKPGYDVDDYAALIIAEKYLKEKSDE